MSKLICKNHSREVVVMLDDVLHTDDASSCDTTQLSVDVYTLTIDQIRGLSEEHVREQDRRAWSIAEE